jgi:hypothetical protein
MTDFFAFMTDKDDPRAFTDAGLKNAHSWIRRELNEVGLDDTQSADTYRTELTGYLNEVQAEAFRRVLAAGCSVP